MPRLDTDYILHGSDSKNLITSYNDLVGNYTQEGAESYSELYKGEKLSFILENSRYIFSEPIYGLDFYKGVVESASIRPCDLQNELNKVNEYMKENTSKMEESQVEKYSSLQAVLTEKVDSMRERIVLESIQMGNGSDISCIKDFYDAVYAYENSEEKDATAIEAIIESMSEDDTIIHAVPTVGYVFEAARGITHKLHAYQNMLVANESAGSPYRQYTKTAMIANLMNSADAPFTESVSNANLKNIIASFAEASIADQLIDEYSEKMESTGIVYTSSKDAVFSLFNEDAMDSMFEEEVNDLKAYMLGKKKASYDACLEYVATYNEVFEERADMEFPEPEFFTSIKKESGITESVTAREALELMMFETSRLEDMITEYTNDGSAGKVFQKNMQGFRENPKAPTTKSGVSSNNQDSDDEDDDDDEKSSATPSGQVAPTNDLVGSAQTAGTADASKPVKPKTGILQKVQNGAMDLHAKSRKGAAAMKQVGTALKNTGKAVLKIPAGMVDGAKNLVKQFDTMDEDHRKAAMLEPGYRKKIFSRMKTLILYGGVMHANILLTPIVWIARSMSKEKNKRVRNEFVAELETEIKVCEEKINDASAAGDQQQKYQLMRLRDKLNIERERVMSNSKYI